MAFPFPFLSSFLPSTQTPAAVTVMVCGYWVVRTYPDDEGQRGVPLAEQLWSAFEVRMAGAGSRDMPHPGGRNKGTCTLLEPLSVFLLTPPSLSTVWDSKETLHILWGLCDS